MHRGDPAAASESRALVTIGGYNVQNTLARAAPGVGAARSAPSGISGTSTPSAAARASPPTAREICRLLWQDWSPGYRFDDATFEATAASFDNPDFVPVVIHSYRHRHGNAPGDPRFDAVEARLAERPPITVPSMVLHGAEDGVDPPGATARDLAKFPAGTERRVVAGAGHFFPREQPGAVVEALRALLR